MTLDFRETANAETTPGPASDRDAVLDEIGRLAWSVRMHCEIIERYAGLGHLVGIDLAAKDARSCLVALIELRKELGDAPGSAY